MGLHRADAGPHHLGRARAAPPARRAFVFQRPTMLRRSAAAKSALCAAAPASAPERNARIDELLELVGLAHLADRPARRLSGGEQQRLALARALARDRRCCSSTSRPRASIPPRPRRSRTSSARVAARRHQGRDVDPRSRRGAPAGGRDRADASRPHRRAGRRGRASSTHRRPRGAKNSSQATCCFNEKGQIDAPPLWSARRHALRSRAGAARRTNRSSSPRRPRRRIPGCSAICCRCSRRRPAST